MCKRCGDVCLPLLKQPTCLSASVPFLSLRTTIRVKYPGLPVPLQAPQQDSAMMERLSVLKDDPELKDGEPVLCGCALCLAACRFWLDA